MKIRPILWTYHKTKTGEYPIKIRVTDTENGKTNIQYFPVKASVRKEEWDLKTGRVKAGQRRNAAEINLKILNMVSDIERNYLSDVGAVPGNKESFHWWFEDRVKHSKAKHGRYNADKLESVHRKLKEYSPALSVKAFNYEFVRGFEAHLLKLGNHPNTVADNLVRLRVIANHILKSRAVPGFYNPFNDIPISKKKTNKQRLTEDQLEKLQKLKVPKDSPSVQTAVNMYLYGFYNGGIRFGDICRQRWDMIENGRLKYVMHKSTVEKNIKLHPWVIRMLATLPKKGPYIFDTGVDWKDEDLSIKRRNSFYRNKLKVACRWAKIPEVSFHTARNTLADIAVKKKVSMVAMKDILGHSRISTTEQYMKSFYLEESDEAMDVIFGGKKRKKK